MRGCECGFVRSCPIHDDAYANVDIPEDEAMTPEPVSRARALLELLEQFYEGDESAGERIEQAESLARDLLAHVERLEAALWGVTSTSRGYPCWCDNSWNNVEHGHQPKCVAARALLAGEEEGKR